MTVFGKQLSEYVQFQKAFLVLLLVVGVLRFALSLGGVSDESVKWISLTGLLVIGCIYYAIRVHTKGFGSYRQLLPLYGIQILLAQIVVAVGIGVAILTAQDNIFTVPEFSGGADGKTWSHAGAHLVPVTLILSLLAWLLGSVVMFITKKVVPAPQDTGKPQDPEKARAAQA